MNRMAVSLVRVKSIKPVRRRVYATVEEAGTRVAEANSSYSPAAAQHMAKFGTAAVDGGVVFSADPLLKRTSGMSFDESQVLAFCAAVTCPVQVVQASKGMMLDDEMMKVAANQMDYQAATTLYTRSLGLIKTAIGKR